MKKFLASIAFVAISFAAQAQTVHEYASVEFSPAIRKLGVFSTAFPSKITDLKTVHMSKSELDMSSFLYEIQNLEGKGWELISQDVVALEEGVHMYVWTLRKPKE